MSRLLQGWVCDAWSLSIGKDKIFGWRIIIHLLSTILVHEPALQHPFHQKKRQKVFSDHPPRRILPYVTEMNVQWTKKIYWVCSADLLLIWMTNLCWEKNIYCVLIWSTDWFVGKNTAQKKQKEAKPNGVNSSYIVAQEE